MINISSGMNDDGTNDTKRKKSQRKLGGNIHFYHLNRTRAG